MIRSVVPPDFIPQAWTTRLVLLRGTFSRNKPTACDAYATANVRWLAGAN